MGVVDPVGGQRQTVPRSELLAFAIALENAPMQFLFVTDHEPLVKAWARGRQHLRDGGNQDLWYRIRVALHARSTDVALKWIPSHMDDATAPLGEQLDPF